MGRAAPALPGRVGGPLLWTGISTVALVFLVLGPGLDWTLRTHPGHVVAAVGYPRSGSCSRRRFSPLPGRDDAGLRGAAPCWRWP